MATDHSFQNGIEVLFCSCIRLNGNALKRHAVNGLNSLAHRTIQHIFVIASVEANDGGLAQLARALAWHARGHRFDSDILHTLGIDGVPLRCAVFCLGIKSSCLRMSCAIAMEFKCVYFEV